MGKGIRQYILFIFFSADKGRKISEGIFNLANPQKSRTKSLGVCFMLKLLGFGDLDRFSENGAKLKSEIFPPLTKLIKLNLTPFLQ